MCHQHRRYYGYEQSCRCTSPSPFTNQRTDRIQTRWQRNLLSCRSIQKSSDSPSYDRRDNGDFLHPLITQNQQNPVFYTIHLDNIRIEYRIFIFSLFYYKLCTRSARIAFKTAMIITPTSAKIAAHIFAIPTAPNARHANLMTNANTIF